MDCGYDGKSLDFVLNSHNLSVTDMYYDDVISCLLRKLKEKGKKKEPWMAINKISLFDMC